MHDEPENRDYQFLSAVREPTRPWQQATPAPERQPTEPETREQAWDPDDVIGALAQWAKDGYEWEDIEARVDELIKHPRRAAPQPAALAPDEPDEQEGIMRNPWRS